MTCPRCGQPLQSATYGPCEPCRLELRATAHVPAPPAPDPEQGETIVRAAEAVVRRLVREPAGPGVPCRLCGDPFHGDGDAHPCCAYWIGEQGRPYCVACAESKKARRERLERHKRNHRDEPDPNCEHCRERRERAA